MSRNLRRLTNAARKLAMTDWPTVAGRRKKADSLKLLKRLQPVEGTGFWERPSDYDVVKRDGLWCVVVPPEDKALALWLLFGRED